MFYFKMMCCFVIYLLCYVWFSCKCMQCLSLCNFSFTFHKDGEPTFSATGESTCVTPTVELNALAMKRGEPAIYRNIENGPHHMYYAHSYDFRGMYNQR